jgi:hypothetical protein
MKHISRIAALLLTLFAAGCNDYAVKTTIHRDGSFERTIICDGDSLGLYSLHLPYVFSDSWNVEIRRKEQTEKSFVTTAKKLYANNDELMAEFARGKDSAKLQISSQIEKRFRWFFTYYDYKETLPPYATFTHLSLDSFFTPTEIGFMKEGKDSLIKKRVDEFWLRNIIEELLKRILVKVEELNDPELTQSLILQKKEALTQELLKSEDPKSDSITKTFETILRTKSAKKLSSTIDSILKDLTAAIEMEGERDVSYKNEVTMPGILLSTNSEKIEGNNVTWQCSSKKYFDVTMTAESRAVNLWAIVLTSIVCILLLVGLLLPIVRGKRELAG